MPYVNVKITREGGTTAEQKSMIIRGVTDVLVEVLGKSPASTFVVIDEVDMEDWGVGGLPVEEYRRQVTPREAASSLSPTPSAAVSIPRGKRRGVGEPDLG